MKESAQNDLTKDVAEVALVSDFTAVANRENDTLIRPVAQMMKISEEAEEAAVSEQIQNMPLEDK